MALRRNNGSQDPDQDRRRQNDDFNAGYEYGYGLGWEAGYVGGLEEAIDALKECVEIANKPLSQISGKPKKRRAA